MKHNSVEGSKMPANTAKLFLEDLRMTNVLQRGEAWRVEASMQSKGSHAEAHLPTLWKKRDSNLPARDEVVVTCEAS